MRRIATLVMWVAMLAALATGEAHAQSGSRF